MLNMVCDLYALSVIEEDKAWFTEHTYLSTERAKAVTRGINERCRTLRPYAETLVDGFGIPEQLRDAACCTRSASAKTTTDVLLVQDRVQCFELAVVAQLEPDLGDSGRSSRGVAALRPLVLNGHRVGAGVQHHGVGLGLGCRGAERGVAVEQQQVLRRCGVGACAYLNPVQAAILGVAAGDSPARHPAAQAITR